MGFEARVGIWKFWEVQILALACCVTFPSKTELSGDCISFLRISYVEVANIRGRLRFWISPVREVPWCRLELSCVLVGPEEVLPECPSSSVVTVVAVREGWKNLLPGPPEAASVTWSLIGSVLCCIALCGHVQLSLNMMEMLSLSGPWC